MTERVGRCGARYGKRRQLVCRRPKGHAGWHAIRMTILDLRMWVRG